MSFSKPKAPDPTLTANTQQQYNTQAAQTQQHLNSFNQATPFGSINYVADANSPSGFRLETALSPVEQGLFNRFTGTQGQAGNAASDLLSKAASFYSGTPNLDETAVANKLNEWSGKYLSPIFNQQSSNLEASLRNQGLTPGSEAYNNAKNLLARNQGDVTTDYLTKNQGQAYGQALQNYMLPLETQAQLGGTLFGMSAPQGPTQLQTPTSQIQPANYQGAVQSNYEQQMKNYENTWNSVGQLAGAAGSLALAPFTGGTSLAGMFARGPSGGWGNLFMGGGSPSGYGR